MGSCRCDKRCIDSRQKLTFGIRLYLSCGIVGATVMPHSLFLGSGLVQARLREFDRDEGQLHGSDNDDKYQPSISAIQNCLNYSIVELSTSLFTFALFINSAILIIAGAALYGNQEAGTADLFGIHQLLSQTIAPIAGTIFALALLLSGTSAGIICTIAGQMVSEGMLNWSIAPWKRRLITRSISIVPSVIVAGAVGRDGLDATLTATQVTLSVILPIVSAPLVYFTARNKYMTVRGRSNMQPDVKMANNWLLSLVSILVWLLLAVLNVAALVLLGLGE
jgi:metal iron transporter